MLENISEDDVIIENGDPIYFTNGYVVSGDLYIDNLETSLPKDLTVKGNCTLKMAGLLSLPTGLKVSSHLKLIDVPITSFPNDARICGRISVDGEKMRRNMNTINSHLKNRGRSGK